MTRKYYKRLHIFPRLYVLSCIYVALLLALSVINSNGIANIPLSIMQYFMIGASLPLLYSILLITKVFNVKRVLALSLVVIISSLPAEIIFYRLTELKGVGLLADSGFIFIILTVFVNPVAAALFSVVPTLIVFHLVNNMVHTMITNNLFITSLTAQSLSLTIGVIYIAFLEHLGKDYGYSPVRIMRAFLNTWFTGNPLKLENEFRKFTSVEDLKVKVILIKREFAETIALIFPTLHYGPFRNVGSARFIYHLESYLEPRIKPFIFHTPGSHEHNLVSSKDSERIAKLIHNAIDEVYKIEAKLDLCRPYRVSLSNGWEAFVLNGPTFIALLVINKLVGNDDLPYELWNYIEGIEIKGRDPIIKAIADSHSFKGDKEVAIKDLKNLIDKAVSKYSCREGEEFFVGYGEGVASLSECRGLCNSLVRVLTFKFKDGKRYALVYIYGNNMEGEFRKLLENEIKNLHNITDVEIVTPDDHSCAASIKESPYDIVSYCKSLVEAVKQALSEAVSNESKAKYSTLEVIIKNVRFVGSKIFDIAYSLKFIGREAERVLLFIILLLNVLPIIFTFIL